MLQATGITDESILQKIKNNDFTGWEELYDCYASRMLGIICKITGDKLKGEEILTKIFTEEAFGIFIENVQPPIAQRLYKHSICQAISMLRSEGRSTIPVISGCITDIFKSTHFNNKVNTRNNIVEKTSVSKAGEMLKAVFVVPTS